MKSDLKCSVVNCLRPVKARGWCTKHYNRWVSTGDPLGTRIPARDLSVEDRLLYRGWTVTETDCWEWNGGRNPGGYGILMVGRNNKFAHRLSYELWVGLIPEGHVVRHKCDNPPCMNPNHLETGTLADNIRDMVDRGRQVRGEAAVSAKLTEEDVRTIRRSLRTLNELATDYGISQSTVVRVRSRRTWAHV